MKIYNPNVVHSSESGYYIKGTNAVVNEVNIYERFICQE